MSFEYCEHDMSTLLQTFKKGAAGAVRPSLGFGKGGSKRIMLGLLAELHHLHSLLGYCIAVGELPVIKIL